MKINQLVLAGMMVIGGVVSSQSSFARVPDCSSAASNVVGNGGSCISTDPAAVFPKRYTCHGSNGADFNLVPSNAATGCSIVYPS